MRWMWIDRILELDRAKRCVAIKNVSLAEEVLHDHFPATADQPACPVMPNPLIIEGMAQTAGILVGHANDFQEKVILAKIAKAEFHAAARPGDQLRFTATVSRIDPAGAATEGVVERRAAGQSDFLPMAQIDLLFSHLDQSRSDLDLPEHNFVFSSNLMTLLQQSGIAE